MKKYWNSPEEYQNLPGVDNEKIGQEQKSSVLELFDDDIICDISIYPGARFRVTLYKTYHFP